MTTLIERLKDQRDRDAAEHCPAEIIALQDETIAAIEALQAENETLREYSSKVFQAKEKLKTENAALKSQLAAAIDAAKGGQHEDA